MNNNNGIITKESRFTVAETIDKLQAALQQHGVTIYTRIDQQRELQNTGQVIRPLEFLLFGNPKAGGPAMAENPVMALDLPLKLIAWQEENGKVWVAFNEVNYLKERHHLSAAVSAAFNLETFINTVLS